MSRAAEAVKTRKRPTLLHFSRWLTSKEITKAGKARAPRPAKRKVSSKRIDPLQIAAQIERLVDEERPRRAQDWRSVVNCATDLPPAPIIAEQALAQMEQSDTTIGRLIDILVCDPALVARIMKVANSAMFGRQRELSSLSEAIMTVGFPTIRGICLAACLTCESGKWGQTEQIIWEHSLCTALACRHVANRMQKSYGEELYALGLLHDLGKLILLRQLPDDYRVIAEETQKGLDYIEAEMEQLGYGHALIGALVADKWNLPEDTCQLIACHHGPELGVLNAVLGEKLKVLRFCDLLVHAVGVGHVEGYRDLSGELRRAACKLQLTEQDVEQLKSEVQQLYLNAVTLRGSGSRWKAIPDKKKQGRKRSRTNSGIFLVRHWGGSA